MSKICHATLIFTTFVCILPLVTQKKRCYVTKVCLQTIFQC